MIPNKSPESVRVNGYVSATSLNAARYALLENDRALSAMFEELVDAASCVTGLTSVITTVSSLSGTWEMTSGKGGIGSFVSTDYDSETPAKSLPCWSFYDHRALSHPLSSRAGLSFDLLVDELTATDDDAHVPSTLVVSGAITSALAAARSGKPLVRQLESPVVPSEMVMWNSVPEDGGGARPVVTAIPGFVTSDLLHSGGLVGYPTQITSPVTEPDYAAICYGPNTGTGTLEMKAIYLSNLNSPRAVLDPFTLETYDDEMVLSTSLPRLGLNQQLDVTLSTIDGAGAESEDATGTGNSKGYPYVKSYSHAGATRTLYVSPTVGRLNHVKLHMHAAVANVITLTVSATDVGGTFDHWAVLAPSAGVSIVSASSRETVVTVDTTLTKRVKIGARFV